MSYGFVVQAGDCAVKGVRTYVAMMVGSRSKVHGSIMSVDRGTYNGAWTDALRHCAYLVPGRHDKCRNSQYKQTYNLQHTVTPTMCFI